MPFLYSALPGSEATSHILHSQSSWASVWSSRLRCRYRTAWEENLWRSPAAHYKGWALHSIEGSPYFPAQISGSLISPESVPRGHRKGWPGKYPPDPHKTSRSAHSAQVHCSALQAAPLPPGSHASALPYARRWSPHFRCRRRTHSSSNSKYHPGNVPLMMSRRAPHRYFQSWYSPPPASAAPELSWSHNQLPASVLSFWEIHPPGGCPSWRSAVRFPEPRRHIVPPRLSCRNDSWFPHCFLHPPAYPAAPRFPHCGHFLMPYTAVHSRPQSRPPPYHVRRNPGLARSGFSPAGFPPIMPHWSVPVYIPFLSHTPREGSRQSTGPIMHGSSSYRPDCGNPTGCNQFRCLRSLRERLFPLRKKEPAEPDWHRKLFFRLPPGKITASAFRYTRPPESWPAQGSGIPVSQWPHIHWPSPLQTPQSDELHSNCRNIWWSDPTPGQSGHIPHPAPVISAVPPPKHPEQDLTDYLLSDYP